MKENIERLLLEVFFLEGTCRHLSSILGALLEMDLSPREGEDEVHAWELIDEQGGAEVGHYWGEALFHHETFLLARNRKWAQLLGFCLMKTAGSIHTKQL